MVFFLGWQLTKKRSIGLLAALFFGLHPIHIEAVTWITASFDTFGMILMLAAFSCFIQFRQQRQRKWYWAAVGLGITAFFINEFALVLPAMLILYDWVYGKSRTVITKQQVVSYLPFIVFWLGYWFVRLEILHIYGRHCYQFGSLFNNMLFMSTVVFDYVKLLLIPLDLTTNHLLAPGVSAFFWADYYTGKYVEYPSLNQLPVLASIIGIGGLVYLAYKYKRTYPLVSWSIGWFLFSLVPVLQVFPQSSLFSEKYVYIGSVSYSILLAWGCYRLLAYKKLKAYQPVFVIGIVLISGVYLTVTVNRNADWKNNLTLWSQSIRANPTSNSLHTNLAQAYFDLGDYDQAEAELKQAIALNPNQPIDWTNLGIIYHQKGLTSQALEAYNRALSLSFGYMRAHNYLGILYHQQRNFPKAIEEYTVTTTLDPTFPYPYYYLGLIYHEQGDLEKAITYYTKAIALKKDYADAYNNLGNVYQQQGDFQKSLQLYQQALSINPHHSFALKNLNDLTTAKPSVQK